MNVSSPNTFQPMSSNSNRTWKCCCVGSTEPQPRVHPLCVLGTGWVGELKPASPGEALFHERSMDVCLQSASSDKVSGLDVPKSNTDMFSATPSDREYIGLSETEEQL